MAFFVPKRRRVIAATLFVVTAVLLGGAWALRSSSTSTAAASQPAASQPSKTQVTVLGTVNQKPKDDQPGERKGKASIGVSGNVTGLYPGAALPLTLKLSNPYSFDVVVTSINVATGAAVAGCGGEWIRAEALAAPVVVAKKSSTNTDITVRMHNDAPGACKNATWALTYSGSADKR